MIRNSFYEQLIKSEPLGFIDPLSDLGEFDRIQMKFKQPVRLLINRHSGKPYSLNWQRKIEEMRVLYIQYQMSLEKEDKDAYYKKLKDREKKNHIDQIVTTYLKLGFNFKEIEKKVSDISYRALQRNWNRSEFIQTKSPEFYQKADLQDGYVLPGRVLPKSMNENK